MSTDVEPIIDTGELRDRIVEMYRDVAESPDGDFHFELGRAVAERLGYPAEWLDAVPDHIGAQVVKEPAAAQERASP